MKKSSVPANKGDKFGQFRVRDAQRIAHVVHVVETARKEYHPSKLPRAIRGGSGIRFGVFSGSWPKGTDKVVVFANGRTANARNTLANISDSGCGSRNCAIVNDSGTWKLLSAEIG